MNKKQYLFFVALMLIIKINASDHNIKDYGAKDALNQLSTVAIQAAIDAANKEGGGTVIIPKGIFVTGTLFLKSNVTIKLKKQAFLYGSTNLADYAEVPIATEEPHFSKCVFYANGIDNFKIIGDPYSEINGRGYFFKHSPERPKLFRIENSTNIEFDNAIIKNSGSWCIYFRECDSVFIHHTSVYNKENHNNDGMNFDGCSNVRIEDCNLQVEDDAICLKSSVDKICENITVKNCTVSSYWASLKFGTASKTGFRNIKVTNCQFFDSRHGTIKLLAVDGAIIENVEISDIKMYNCGGPIFIRLGNRGRTYDTSIKQVYSTDVKPEGRPVGKIKNVILRNIEGRLTGRMEPPTEGIMFTGLPEHYIEDVVLENIRFSYTGFGDLDTKNREVPEDEARYPEQLFFGPLPSYGMYLRHIKGLKMKNIVMELRSHDNRPAMVLDDVLESSFENITTNVSPEAGSVAVLKNTKHITFKNIVQEKGVNAVLDIKGELSENIQLINTDISALGIATEGVFNDGASKTALSIKKE